MNPRELVIFLAEEGGDNGEPFPAAGEEAPLRMDPNCENELRRPPPTPPPPPPPPPL